MLFLQLKSDKYWKDLLILLPWYIEAKGGKQSWECEFEGRKQLKTCTKKACESASTLSIHEMTWADTEGQIPSILIYFFCVALLKIHSDQKQHMGEKGLFLLTQYSP